MNQQKLLGVGIVGTLVAALSCFTPVLVVILGAAGLTGIVGSLDYVLVPAMLGFAGLAGYALWRRRTGREVESPVMARDGS